MNKKLSLLLVLVLAMSLMLTACGPNMMAYMEKNAETEKWEATEGKINVVVDMKMEDPATGEPMNFKMPMDMEMYIVGQDKGKIDVNYDLTGIKAMAPTPEEGAIFPDNFKFTMYIAENKVIMPKEIFTFGMEEAPEIEIIKGEEKYIAFDLSEFGVDMAKNGQTVAIENFADIIEKAYEGYKSDFDMKREGDKFSYEITVEEGQKEIKSFIKYTKANSDTIFNALDTLLVTLDSANAEMNKAMLAEAKTALAGLDDAKIDEAMKEFGTMLKGSKISEVTEFKADSVNQNVKMVLNLDGLFTMDMDMKADMKKAAVKEIVIPTDVKVITYSEYMESVMASIVVEEGDKAVVVLYNGQPIEFDATPVIEDGRTLVPFRAFFEKLGATVEWNEEKQEVYAKHGETEILLTIGSKVAVLDGTDVGLDKEAKLVDGRTLVPLRFISENFGFEVEFQDTPYAFVIEVMTKEFAEEIKAMGED